ncbi:hypothetical protein BGX26_002535, partial [Mortierella sp. AD094]
MVKALSILLLSAACAVASARSIKVPLHKRGNPHAKEIVHADNHRWATLRSDPILFLPSTIFTLSTSSTSKDPEFSGILEYGSGNATIDFYKDDLGIDGYKICQTFGVASDVSAIG